MKLKKNRYRSDHFFFIKFVFIPLLLLFIINAGVLILLVVSRHTENDRFIIFYVTTLTACATLFIFYTFKKISLKYLHPLEMLKNRIAKFPDSARYPAVKSEVKRVNDLSLTVSRFLTEMRNQLKGLHLEKELLSSLLHGLDEGVLCINREGIVLFQNQALSEELVNKNATGHSYAGVIRNPEMLAYFKEFLNLYQNATKHRERFQSPLFAPQTSDSIKKLNEQIEEKSLLFQHGRKHFRLHCYPILMESEPELFLAIIYDDTQEVNTQRLREDFLQNASHELKTPITSIRGYAETLLYRAGDDVYKKFLQALLRNVERMERLIGDMVTISSLESGRFPFHPEKIEVSEFMEGIRELVSGLISGTSLSLHVSIVPEDGICYADPLAIEHLLLNLISNAVKHAPENSSVSLLFECNNEHAFIKVTDSGEGVEFALREKVFERFFRIDKDRSRSDGGTGLGLSIVKQIAKMHGGKVWIEDRDDGIRGASFCVLFPQQRMQDEVNLN